MTMISMIESDARRYCLIHRRSPFLRVIRLEGSKAPSRLLAGGKSIRQGRAGPRTGGARAWPNADDGDMAKMVPAGTKPGFMI
jgi:hypothetical protein